MIAGYDADCMRGGGGLFFSPARFFYMEVGTWMDFREGKPLW